MSPRKILPNPDSLRAHWNNLATKRLLGRKIVGVRYMTDEERIHQGWGEEKNPIMLMLDDNSVWFPSRDDEGNGPGALYGMSWNQEDISLPVI